MLIKEKTFQVQYVDTESLLASFLELQQEIRELKSYIEAKLEPAPSQDSLLLTREEVAKFFKINISTVRNWSKRGIIQPYFTGDRVFFKKHEILNALIPSNINNKKK